MTIKGTEHQTGTPGVSVKVDFRGTEVGLVSPVSGVYWKPKDFDRLIYELIKVRDAMKEEGLL